tara:strand:+ start:208 stop:852 length:645 start_codon:yes stop_codon:yes gene_type:complete
MTSFTTYNKAIEMYLANSSETFFDNSMKIEAINEAVDMFTRNFDMPQMHKKATLAVVNGITDIPADNLRILKIYTLDSGVQNQEYLFVDNDDFDKLASTAGHYFTVQYDVATDSRKIYILPDTITEVEIRYLKKPDAIAIETDDDGVDAFYKHPIAIEAAAILLENSGRYDEANFYHAKAKTRMRDCVRKGMQDAGRPQVLKFKSRYEDINYMN